jgi:hypothetical protein
VRRNVKKSAGLWWDVGTVYFGYGDNVSSRPSRGLAGYIRQNCATQLPRLPHFTHKDAQAVSGINILAQLGGDEHGKRRTLVNISLVLDILKLLILLLDIARY